MAISRRKVKVEHYLAIELAQIMRRTRARHTDVAGGRFNWSEVLEALLRRYIAELPPKIRAQLYAGQVEDLELAAAELRERARHELGTSLEVALAANGGSVKIHTKR